MPDELPPVNYELRVYEPPSATPPYLNLRGVVSTALFKWSIRYGIAANKQRSFTATLEAESNRADWFEVNSIVVVRRKLGDLPWRVENAYVIRYRNGQSSPDALKLVIGGPDLYYFARKTQMVPAVTDPDGYSRKSGTCDVVMKDYVTDQIGVGASAERRCPYLLVTGYLDPAEQGEQVSEAARYGVTLLDVLERLVPKGGLDFWFEWLPPNVRFRTGEFGTDRTVTGNPGGPFVVFTRERGNIMDVRNVDDWRAPAMGSVAYVMGAGRGVDQEVIARPASGLAYGDATQWLDRVEIAVDAPEAEGGDTTALETAGDKALSDLAPLRDLELTARQVPGTLYGRDYFAGDKVTASDGGIVADYRLEVEVYLSGDGGQTIDVEFERI